MKSKFSKLLLVSSVVMLLSVIFCFNTSALDSTGECGIDGDNVTWSYDWQSGKLVISGEGYMDIYGGDYGDSPFKGADVKSVVIEEGVWDVAEYAFENCTKLTSVKLPSSVAVIGERAFYGCTALYEIVLPANLEYIGNYAFYKCEKLEGITIPEGVWYLGESAFSYCSSITSVYIPGSVTTVGKSAFYSDKSIETIVLGEGIEEIGAYAFQNCSEIDKITLPKSVVSIGSKAFYNMFDEVTFQGSINSMSADAFGSSVKTLNLLEGVAGFDFTPFKGVSDMDITVLNKELDVYPFEMGEYSTVYCYNESAAHKGAVRKDKIYVSLFDDPTEEAVTTGTYENISYAFSSKTGTLTISGSGAVPSFATSKVPWDSSAVKKLVFTAGITDIGTDFNTYFPSLVEVSVPGTVSTLKENAFKNCSKLEKINLSEGLKTIKTDAIWYCNKLEEVVVPASVTMIECYSIFSHKIKRVVVLNPNCTMGHYQYGISNENVVAEETVVYGYSGSTAQTYATRYKRTFKVYCPHNNITEQAATEPTCTAVGYTAGKYCSDCDTWFEGHEIKPVLHQWKSVSCSAPKNCTKCGFKVGPTLDHEYNPATCTEQPTCKNCGHKEGDALGHDPEVVRGKQPTCIEKGLTDGEKCARCGVTLVERKELDFSDHIPEPVPAKPATCTKTGLTEGEACGICGKVFVEQQETPMISHVPEDFEGRSPTCIKEGLTPGKKCKSCGTPLEGMESIPLSDHAWKKADCVNPKTCAVCGATEGVPGDHNWEPATCTVPSTCPGCNKTKGESLGHDYMESTCNDYKFCKRCGTDEMFEKGHRWENADCLRPRTCEVCQLTDGDPLNHEWNEATCTVPRTCRVCNSTEGVAKGHSWSNGQCENSENLKVCVECNVRYVDVMGGHSVEIIPAKEPTCNEPGNTEGRKCRVCGAVMVQPGTIPVTGHDWVAATCTSPKSCTKCKATEGKALGHKETLIKGKAATCTNSGLSDGKKCTVCKEITVEQKEIPATGHKIVATAEREATCTEKGVTSAKSCSVCYTVIANAQEIPSLGHKIVTIPAVPATYKSAGKTAGKKCSRCGTITSAQRKVARKKLGKVKSLKVKSVTATTAKLSWKKVTGAESYTVYYSTNGKKWKTVKATKNSVTIKKLSAAKNYQFKVKAVAGKYSGSASSVVKKTTKFTTATISKVTSSKKKQATVTWKKVKNADGYVIEYSTSKKFTEKTTKSVTVKKGKTTKTTLKKLKSGKKYYVRVKAYKTVNKKAVYGEYSKVKTVKVK